MSRAHTNIGELLTAATDKVYTLCTEEAPGLADEIDTLRDKVTAMLIEAGAISDGCDDMASQADALTDDVERHEVEDSEQSVDRMMQHCDRATILGDALQDLETAMVKASKHLRTAHTMSTAELIAATRDR